MTLRELLTTRANARETVHLRSERDHCVPSSLRSARLALRRSEGIMALQSPELRSLYDLKIFVVRIVSLSLHFSLDLMGIECRLGSHARSKNQAGYERARQGH